MDIASELDQFNFECFTVVQDADSFRAKLSIGSEAFKKLATAEKAGEALLALSATGGSSAVLFAGWYASLGLVAKIGFGIGLVATPYGPMAIGGSLAAMALLSIRKFYKSLKKDAVVEVPKFINSPIDVLGMSICSLIYPVALKIAHADNSVDETEMAAIRKYFVEQWGISASYVDQLHNELGSKAWAYAYERLKADISQVEKTGDVKAETLAQEIVAIAEDVMRADGRVHESESAELGRLRLALGVS
ncbi:MAG: hypothetical protein CALGDGBN_03306 [Pseudomonadales bacterium]|nr:hypothetical protein [Pseudomonadales bacterium]